MKNKLFIALIAMLSFSSCSEDELSKGPTDFKYSNATIDVDFYTSNSTAVPTLNWNEDVGTFGLGFDIEGVSVNNTNGVVSWDGDLPLGTSIVEVSAENIDGVTTSTLKLNHIFGGSFTGGYNYDHTSTQLILFNYSMDFETDGTLNVDADGAIAKGTWVRIGNKIKANYKYDNDEKYFFEADIKYTNSDKPSIAGYFGPTAENLEGGFFKINMD